MLSRDLKQFASATKRMGIAKSTKSLATAPHLKQFLRRLNGSPTPLPLC
jgi:hypothetical protein